MNNFEFIKKCTRTELAKLLVEYAETIFKEVENGSYVQKVINAETFLTSQIDTKKRTTYEK